MNLWRVIVLSVVSLAVLAQDAACDGGQCHHHRECCQNEYCSSIFYSCFPAKTLGDKCNAISRCAFDLACEENRCVGKVYCTTDSDCGDLSTGRSCSAALGWCVPGRKRGAYCNSANSMARCEEGLECSAQRCVTKLRCSPLPSPDHGAVSIVGSRAVYACDPGHLLTMGHTSRLCGDDGWDGRAPRCEAYTPPTTCADDASFGNGYGKCADYAKGSKLSLWCDQDRASISCPVSCGKCDPPEPSCSALLVQDGTIAYAGGGDGLQLGSTATITCGAGFVLEGAAQLRCSPALVWVSALNAREGPGSCQSDFARRCLLSPSSPELRIVGGQATRPRQHPSFAAITTEINEDNQWYATPDKMTCGGTLIHPNWVLTAAHCQELGQVVMGVHSVLERNAIIDHDTPCYETSDIVEAIQHEDAEFEFTNAVDDIQLLRLATPSVYPVAKLNTRAALEAAGSPTTVVGLGVISNRGIVYPDVVQAVDLPMTNLTTCIRDYNGLGTVFPEFNICAGASDGRDSCVADSGGPLFSGVDGSLLGVVSWGSRECGTLPGVYTRVRTYLDWICKHTDGDVCY